MKIISFHVNIIVNNIAEPVVAYQDINIKDNSGASLETTDSTTILKGTKLKSIQLPFATPASRMHWERVLVSS